MMAILRLSFLLTWLVIGISSKIEIMNQWNFLRYEIPFLHPKLNNTNNIVFTGMEVGWDRIYLATPRIWPGNPATVAWIPRNSFEDSTIQQPLLQVNYNSTSINGFSR